MEGACLNHDYLIAFLVAIVLMIVMLLLWEKKKSEGWSTGGAVVSVQQMDQTYF